jgi:hypothetical protein
MGRFVWPIAGAVVVTLVGIATNVPIVIAIGTLTACGLLLGALLSYFHAVT